MKRLTIGWTVRRQLFSDFIRTRCPYHLADIKNLWGHSLIDIVWLCQYDLVSEWVNMINCVRTCTSLCHIVILSDVSIKKNLIIRALWKTKGYHCSRPGCVASKASTLALVGSWHERKSTNPIMKWPLAKASNHRRQQNLEELDVRKKKHAS
jgi:hypothetical protein